MIVSITEGCSEDQMRSSVFTANRAWPKDKHSIIKVTFWRHIKKADIINLIIRTAFPLYKDFKP